MLNNFKIQKQNLKVCTRRKAQKLCLETQNIGNLCVYVCVQYTLSSFDECQRESGKSLFYLLPTFGESFGMPKSSVDP